MLPEIDRFQKWLRRKAPHASTPIHYCNDLELFFTWLGKPITDVNVKDVDRYIEYCLAQPYAVTHSRIVLTCRAVMIPIEIADYCIATRESRSCSFDSAASTARLIS